jgi:two-component system copper resistance phosphate regulon response regulator CusR
MRALVIEDNIKTAEYICKGLKETYFTVDVAHDGEDGLHLAVNNQYDIIILDVMMPKMDGWNVVKKIREQDSQTPVLFLTARDQVDDRVKGFELGADDYLIKPFAFSELIARIRSLLRRKQPLSNDTLTIADLEIDIVKHRATRGDVRLNLTAKEFMLLVLLAKRSGEVLSRTYIAEQVWDINFDSDTNVVDVAIRRLRQKVDDRFEKKLIHTVRGMGYLLEEQ